MPQVETAAPSTITGAALHAFIESRREPGERLYAVVDAAQDKELAFEGALRYGWKLQWLFSEDTDRQMGGVAPYLVPITFESNYPFRESDYLDLWAERLGSNAGILLLTGSGPEELRGDLSSVFQVVDEDGTDGFFRFYDPRVLRFFANVCTLGEAKNLFGTIRQILVEGESPGALLACTMDAEGVAIETANIAATPLDQRAS